MIWRSHRVDKGLVRKNMDVNEHNRESSFTLRHKSKENNNAFIAVLHITVVSSIMNITHTTLK